MRKGAFVLPGLAILFCLFTVPTFAAGKKAAPAAPAAKTGAQYVGSAACEGCHEKEYSNFMKYAKKAHSDRSVKLMARKLTPAELKGCYACHTTGYGQPGGFVSFEKTPELGHAGCEVCHGPGSAHVDSGGNKSLIKGRGRLSLKDCERCHNPERVANFRYKPMLFGGAH